MFTAKGKSSVYTVYDDILPQGHQPPATPIIAIYVSLIDLRSNGNSVTRGNGCDPKF